MEVINWKEKKEVGTICFEIRIPMKKWKIFMEFFYASFQKSLSIFGFNNFGRKQKYLWKCFYTVKKPLKNRAYSSINLAWRFEADFDFSRPWFSEIKVQIKRFSNVPKQFTYRRIVWMNLSLIFIVFCINRKVNVKRIFWRSVLFLIKNKTAYRSLKQIL